MKENQIRDIPSLSLVIPCYNEEEILEYCYTNLTKLLLSLISKNKITNTSYILFIDDGSKDKTWEIIRGLSEKDKLIRGVKLSRNKGHQIALLAGLSSVDTDVCISIDADLQDDINCIEKMLDAYMLGNDIVYGVRNKRDTDSFFKRVTANSFYKVMSIMGVEQVENHADYRLLSKKALDSLLQFQEQNVYMRGMIPLIGYKSEKVYYARNERIAGESKYPLKKMLALAINGITSFTITPLRIISSLGFITCFISLIMIFWSLIVKLQGNSVEGWTSMFIAICFWGGGYNCYQLAF
ncbi:glycosyltransferase family 2 protein [Gallibacterium genomosp. 3]|uniref:glycosyltransferase family 2 protein n=1 Tax=Gallibacterium genomosp. 3 TaxID=505345 RepID=UPI000AA1A1DC|nr:glycosyltransferase family 2 protein [Gallibacterium genomosp. 3]